MSTLVAVTADGTPTTTSIVIADGTQLEHRAVLQLIQTHIADFEEFGRVAFEMRPFETAGGTQQRRIAVLTEEQATLLITYLRNTEVVRAFKRRLVAEFFAMRRALSAPVLGDPLDELDTALNRTRQAIEIAREERSRADRAERKLEVEQKHRAAIEGGDGIDLTTFGKKYFSEVRKTDFDKHLYQRGYLINQHNARARADGSVADGYDHRKPTAKGRKFIYSHDTGTHGGRRRFTPRVRPQMEIALRDRLAAEGLPANEHSTGLVLLTADDMKELTS